MNRFENASLLSLARWAVFLSSIVLFSIEFSRTASAQTDGLGWETVKLDLEVTMRPREKRISVNGVLRVKLVAPESFGPTIRINSGTANMKFTKVEANGASEVLLNQKLPSSKAVRLAKIKFSEPFKRGAELDVVFEYESKGESGQFGVNEQAAIGSWVDTWHPIPLFDSNSNVSLSSASKSVGTLTLHLPPDWRGAAEGELVSRTKSDTERVEVWECTKPVARSFAAGKYFVASEKVGDRNISVYRLDQTGISAQRLAKTIAEILASLETKYGPYPYQNYSIIEVPSELGKFGAASLQGMIYVKPLYFGFKGGSIPLFAHEMAHGWWGNLVGTRGSGSILCSESLAQYSAAIALESRLGEKAATEFMRFSREDYIPIQCAWGYFELWREGHDTEMSKLKSGGHFHSLSDSKGHWIFHMLRRRVGEEVFFATLRSFIADYADKQMSLNDVRKAFIKAAPDARLKQFFSQWLDQKGAPILEVDYSKSGDRSVNVTIEQKQPGKPYHLQLDLGLKTSDNKTTIQRVELDKRKQTFELSVQEQPVAVVADPQHRLLIWTPEYGENPLVARKKTGVEKFLQAFLGKPTVASPLSAEQLEVYVGDFEVEGLGAIRFTNSDGELMAKVPNEPQHPMEYIEGHQFKAMGNTITFTVEDGRATQFVVEKGIQKLIGKRKDND